MSDLIQPIKTLCPICETNALQVTHLPAQQRYLLRCWNCPDGTTGEWLSRLAKAVDPPTYPDALIRDPFGKGGLQVPAVRTTSPPQDHSPGPGNPAGPYVEGYTGTGPDDRGSGWGRFPSKRDIERMSGELLRNPSALAARLWLRDERLITRYVLQRAQVGWWSSREVLVFPLFDSQQQLVNVRVRRPQDGAKIKSWPAVLRPDKGASKDGAFPLFPPVQVHKSELFLCAGELDALALLSQGTPATSVTSGVGTWFESYTEALRERNVLIAFDKGEERAAEHVHKLLPNSTIHRWPDGCPKGFDVTDWLKGGGMPIIPEKHKE